MFLIAYRRSTKVYHLECEHCGKGTQYMFQEPHYCMGCHQPRSTYATKLMGSSIYRVAYFREGSQREKGNGTGGRLPN